VSQLDLARRRFARTSIDHVLVVPVTIGTALLVAVLHTQWSRTGNPEHRAADPVLRRAACRSRSPSASHPGWTPTLRALSRAAATPTASTPS